MIKASESGALATHICTDNKHATKIIRCKNSPNQDSIIFIKTKLKRCFPITPQNLAACRCGRSVAFSRPLQLRLLWCDGRACNLQTSG